MIAIIQNGKFTGVVYDELTPPVKAWLDKYGASYIYTDTAPTNIGTVEAPDYGAPTAEQIAEGEIAQAQAEINAVETMPRSVRELILDNVGSGLSIRDETLEIAEAEEAMIESKRVIMRGKRLELNKLKAQVASNNNESRA